MAVFRQTKRRGFSLSSGRKEDTVDMDKTLPPHATRLRDRAVVIYRSDRGSACDPVKNPQSLRTNPCTPVVARVENTGYWVDLDAFWDLPTR